MDPDISHQWLIEIFSLGEWQSVTEWVTHKELRGWPIALEAMMDSVCIKERKNATAIDPAPKRGTMLGEEPDV